MPLSPLARKLEPHLNLTADERAALAAVVVREGDIRADQDVVREGDRPTRSFFVLEGMVCSYKFTGLGKRQILGFYLPGDAPDLQSCT